MGAQDSGVRRVVRAALGLVAAISFVVGAVSLAARSTLYEPANAAGVAERLLAEPAVRLAIAEKLTTRIQVLEPLLRREPASDLLEQLAELLTTTEPFRLSFAAAVTSLQRDLLEGGAPQVVLRLDGMLLALRDGMERTGGDLPVPEGQLTGVIVVERQQVNAYRRLDDVSRRTGWPLLAIGALAAVGAVLVSDRRRSAVVGVGAGVAATSLIALGSLALGKSAAAGQARTAKGQDAVDAVWDVVARDIRSAIVIVLVGGLAAIVIGLALRVTQRRID